MKLGPVTKLDKRNKITSKKSDDEVMSANFDVNVIFSIYAQLGKLEKHTSLIFAAQKMKFYIKDPFSKCNQT